LGVAYVPEQRGIFPHLSVLDNVRAQLRHVVPRRERSTAVERALEVFPVLAERRRQAAGTLSGGEQQMLGLARVLAAPPRLLIADEMSLGLAPKLVDLVFESLARARAEGVTTVLVEQYVDRALEFADEAVILRRGEVVWRGAASVAGAETVAGYLGDPVGGASEASATS
jgi:branched-chain amino acid transport system ATP-binding protein